MRKVLTAGLVALLCAAFVFVSGLPATQVSAETSELELARQAGIAKIAPGSFAVSVHKEWEGAALVDPQAYQDLNGDIIAYMFRLVNDGVTVGSILVGTSSYLNKTLEIAPMPPPSTPTQTEAALIISRDLGLNVSAGSLTENPKVVYLGYGSYFAVYDTSPQAAAVDLRHARAVSSDNLESKFMDPLQFQNAFSSGGQSLLSGSKDISSVPFHQQLYDYDCGPTSGAMVTEYQDAQWGYDNYYPWSQDRSILSEEMGTDPDWGTHWLGAASGLESYSEYCDYMNFDAWAETTEGNWFDEIVQYIDEDAPHLICFFGAPYADAHYCAIRGYDYDDWMIVVNDPWYEDGAGILVEYLPNAQNSNVVFYHPVGHTARVSLQGGSRPFPAGYEIPITVKLFAPGQNVMTGTPSYVFDTTGHGWVTREPVTVDFEQITGTYHITVKSPHTLTNVRYNVAFANPTAVIDMGTLLEGNCNDDGQINALDFSTLASSYLKSVGQYGYNATADFDRTGTVNSLDFSLLAANYLKSSPREVGSGASMPTGALTEAVADLTLQPDTQTVSVNDTFNVTVQVASGTQKVSGVDAFIDFDPAYLEVVSVTNGTSLPIENYNQYDNDAGTIDFSDGKTGSAGVTGTFTVATIQFRALAETEGTSLSFVQSGSRNTEAAYNGDSALNSVTGATIIIDP